MLTADSPLIGRTPEEVRSAPDAIEVNLLAIAPRRPAHRDRGCGMPHSIPATSWCSKAGRHVPEMLSRLGCLPLAGRNLTLGRPTAGLFPVLVLAGRDGADHVQPTGRADRFLRRRRLVVLLRSISPREAYEAVEWPIIVMLGCLIPVGEALKRPARPG